jgi:hypothetical protein
MSMDHDSMRLLLELAALALAVGLGVWRLVWLRRQERDGPLAEYRYDMRRDGQRVGVP